MSEITKLDQHFIIKKIDKETINIQLTNNEMLMSIVGEFDQNLKDLEKLSSTNIFFRGNSITCKGKRENIDIFREAIKFLVDKYFNLQKKYYNLPTKKFTNIKKHYIKTLNDFEELNRLNDEVLVLIGTFNNVILSDCYKNGCLNPKCNLNKIFKEDYRSRP